MLAYPSQRWELQLAAYPELLCGRGHSLLTPALYQVSNKNMTWPACSSDARKKKHQNLPNFAALCYLLDNTKVARLGYIDICKGHLLELIFQNTIQYL